MMRAFPLAPSLSPPLGRAEPKLFQRLAEGPTPQDLPSFASKTSLVTSQSVQACFRVAEAIELHSHPVHEGQIQAAQLAVIVAGV
jgi:hypothetical protein